MKRYRIIISGILLISLFVSPARQAYAQSDSPVVHAVLFYSPTCPHCHLVINETIVPLVEKYGDQLQIIGIDITQQQGQTLFLSTIQKFNLDSAGVPFLVINDIYLIGSADIPDKFPGLVETYLEQGGVDWPDLPGLSGMLSTSPEENSSTDQPETPHATLSPVTASPSALSPTATPKIAGIHTETSNWFDTFARDPAGNTLSVVVLMGMLGSIAWTFTLFKKTKGVSLKGNWEWIVPPLCVIGFSVAGYLAYVEITQAAAVCGPVGDCNTVQQSEYAILFGVLPIGILGMFGYVAIFIAWLATQFTRDHLADLAAISIFAMTAFGTLFSIYLTFLEPFVIGATCAWCLTSAIIMTLLMLFSAEPAKVALFKKGYAVRRSR